MSRVTSRARKRPRKASQLGAPQENDADLPTPHSQANAPSSAAWSRRNLPSPHPPSLSLLSIRAFAYGLARLHSQPAVWEDVGEQLTELPSTLIPRLSEALREICPTVLTHSFIATYLLRGALVVLTDELPGINKFTIAAIGTKPGHDQLVELHLRKLENITDDLLASTVSKLHSLKTLNLRECIKAGPKTAEAAGQSCPKLTVVNFSFTVVTPISLNHILQNCKELEVLKLAGIQNCTDVAVNKLWASLEETGGAGFQLPTLKTLKLRQTYLSDNTINTMLASCPNLRRLDLSFTHVRHPPLLLSNCSLEKLCLTSTMVSSVDLIKIVSGLTELKTLSLGAMGRGAGSVAAVTNSTAMTLTDDALRKLTAQLTQCTDIEHVNLVGNTKLGAVSRGALVGFVQQVGRRCKTLNLAGIPFLRSSDLEGLLADNLTEPPAHLRTLILNNTGVDDAVAPFIASCEWLQTLEVGSTRLTSAGLDEIIDACTHLENLNLTSCRGVDVAHRRRYFEVYDENNHPS